MLKNPPSSGLQATNSGPPGSGSSAVREVEERFSIGDLREESQRLEKLTAEDRVAWVLDRFPEDRVALTSSFGAQSAVSLHMVTSQKPDIPVILVDTGYLFPETYQFIDALTDRLHLNLKVVRPEISAAWQEARYDKLWEQGIEGIQRYNKMNKVEPVDRALAELNIEAWISGLRRQQSVTRENLPVLVAQKGRVKAHPIIDWTDRDIGTYLTDHDLPYHPLWDEGYTSIGDWHTSHKLTGEMKPEDARFFGLKRECGLHEEVDFVI